MFHFRKWLACGAVLYAGICRAQEWSEAQVLERFQTASAQSAELRARVALAEAEARTRTMLPNPSASYSREGAGYAEFFQLTQTLPITGRIKALRDAGTATVAAADAERESLLWSLRSDLRINFYRMVAAQERVRLLASSTGEIDRLITLLRQRETEGEGSRYDRVRAERELAEIRTDQIAAQAFVAAAGARVALYLPEASVVQRVTGALTVTDAPPLDDLLRRAMAARPDYRAGQKSLARFQAEEQAARRLRYPEPVVSAGVKRGNVAPEITRTGVAFSVSVPILAFNKGQYEVARYQSEQQQVQAHMATIARQIQAEVQGARDVLAIRRDALAAYRREVETAGTELTRITQAAYQEGEAGILEVLDSLRVNRLASLRLLDLEAGAKEAFIELERAVGEEVRP